MAWAESRLVDRRSSRRVASVEMSRWLTMHTLIEGSYQGFVGARSDALVRQPKNARPEAT